MIRRFWRAAWPCGGSRWSSGVAFDATHIPGLRGKYLRALQHRPVSTAIVTSAVLWTVGDVTAQMMELREERQQHPEKESVGQLKWRRLFGTVAEGSLISGGLGVFWYAALDRFVGLTLGLAAGSVQFVLAKLSIEFALWHPFTLALFWGIVGVAEGHSVDHIAQELSTDFVPTLLTEYVLWAPIDALNFKVVPVHLQVVFVNLGSLIEAVLLSYIHAHGFPTSEVATPQSQDTLQDVSHVPRMRQNFRPRKLQTFLVVPKTVHEAAREFDRIDAGRRGYITYDEFKAAMQTGIDGRPLRLAGVHDAAVNSKLAELLCRYVCLSEAASPAAAAPVLHREDFLRMVSAFASCEFRSALLTDVVFSLFDADGNGFLDATEIPNFLDVFCGPELTSEARKLRYDAVMAAADDNRDGQISVAEMRKLMKHFV